MNIEDIKAKLLEKMPNAEISIDGDGYHFEAIVISDAFEGLNRIKRSQLVYGILNHWIETGELHAISLKTLTPSEAKHG